jgi:hypothetical protein
MRRRLHRVAATRWRGPGSPVVVTVPGSGAGACLRVDRCCLSPGGSLRRGQGSRSRTAGRDRHGSRRWHDAAGNPCSPERPRGVSTPELCESPHHTFQTKVGRIPLPGRVGGPRPGSCAQRLRRRTGAAGASSCAAPAGSPPAGTRAS